MDRKTLRRTLLTRRLALAQRTQSALALERVLLPWLRQRHGGVRCIGAYWPIQGEFDPLPALLQHQADGCRAEIALPVADVRRHALRFHAWQPGCAMRNNTYGIPEPHNTPPRAPDLLLVPCLGHGDGGWRLGYGGGFYDRLLAPGGGSRPFAVGLAYACGYIQGFAGAAHDVAMDAILTEDGVIYEKE